MNIFYVEESPCKSARSLCDKHVVKMGLESLQLLCTNLFLRDEGLYDSTYMYKPTHINHPCSKWLLESKGNVKWLLEHNFALFQEYTRRYEKIHSCQKILERIECILPPSYRFAKESMTEPRQCMPEQYKIPGDPIQAYRSYMIGEKTRFARWKSPATKPEWWS